MAATNQQVQNWSDQRSRVRAEEIRNLKGRLQDDNASIGEVYAHLTDNPTWTDSRSDGPPALLTPNDLLALNTISVQLAAILGGTLANDAAKIAACNDVAAQMAIVSKACVRGI